MISDELIRERLHETMQWCAFSAHHRHSFTSPTPDTLRDRRLRPPSWYAPEFGGKPAPERDLIVEALADARVRALRHWGKFYQQRSTLPAGGRLLWFAPDDSLSEGASEIASRGLIDLHDEPPWDTWVCYIAPHHVLCWIPAPLVDFVDAGIRVQSVPSCLFWVDSMEPRLLEYWRRSGLLDLAAQAVSTESGRENDGPLRPNLARSPMEAKGP
jgi:hypothetical protein